MAKYIDADKLKAEIERLEVLYDEALKNPSFSNDEAYLIAKGKHRQREDILRLIDSLQQEQPEDIVVVAKAFLDALSKTPYNNKPITDAQIIVKQLLLFFESPKEYNPDAILEQPEVDLENKFGWHNVSEETPKFGDYVIVACKNKNKEDGIWLYDFICCWEGKWEPRENWETPLKWISVDELGLNSRKED